MRKAFIAVALILAVMVVVAAPRQAYAANIEFLDEINLGVELDAPALIYAGDLIEVGAAIGTKNLEDAKANLYAVGKVTVKWSLIDRRTK